MKRFLILIVLVVGAIAATGLYRGWFIVSSDGGTDKTHVTLTVDKDKIHADEAKAVDQAKDKAELAREKVADVAEKHAK